MAEVVFRDGAELLIDSPMSSRGERFMRRMADAAPGGSIVTDRYRGKNYLLMMYGPGSPKKLPLVQRHIKAGGRVAMWDLGYWDRERSMRLSINTLHPTPYQLEQAPEGGHRRTFELREDADPNGPILLIGIGPKSCYAYGLRPFQWESEKLADLRRRFPGRKVLWRPKGHTAAPLGGLEIRHGGAIEDVLRGCSLVVCRHSNVAVDACVAGIPVECDDGAALALYGKSPDPTRDERAEFLRRLSWWEWHVKESLAAWQWIERVTCD